MIGSEIDGIMQRRGEREIRKVAIVVPTWNNRELLRNCLSSLKNTRYAWYKVIVVDNGSSDGSSELVNKEFPDIDVIRLSRNEGFSAGVNTGIRLALSRYNVDYCVVLSDDTFIVNDNWLLHMIGVAESDPTIGIVNCRFLRPDGRSQPMGLRLLPGVYLDSFLGVPVFGRNQEQSAYVHETDSAGGACFILKRSLVDGIGLLDERYSPAYFEDVDYGLRARKAGFKLVHDGEVSIIHVGSATARKLPDHYLSYIYKRNLIRFVSRNYAPALPFILFGLVIGSCMRAFRSCMSPQDRKDAVLRLHRDVQDTILALRDFRRVR
ncbi:MAG: glycosyltransferase family 2 protein [Thaumarchaeota archaeon]|nr:glycosyltransferase family 2 protein [Nitrososphaerota archaeon]